MPDTVGVSVKLPGEYADEADTIELAHLSSVVSEFNLFKNVLQAVLAALGISALAVDVDDYRKIREKMWVNVGARGPGRRLPS